MVMEGVHDAVGSTLDTAAEGVVVTIVVVVTHLGRRVVLDSGLRLVNLKSRSRRLTRGVRDSGRRRGDDALRLVRLRVRRGQLLGRELVVDSRTGERAGRGADDGRSRAYPTTVFSFGNVELVLNKGLRLRLVRSRSVNRSVNRSRNRSGFLDVPGEGRGLIYRRETRRYKYKKWTPNKQNNNKPIGVL